MSQALSASKLKSYGCASISACLALHLLNCGDYWFCLCKFLMLGSSDLVYADVFRARSGCDVWKSAWLLLLGCCLVSSWGWGGVVEVVSRKQSY